MLKRQKIFYNYKENKYKELQIKTIARTKMKQVSRMYDILKSGYANLYHISCLNFRLPNNKINKVKSALS